MKIGYAKKITDETQQAFSLAGTVKNFSKQSSQQTDKEYFENFLMDHKDDEIILNSLESIGVFTFVQLSTSLKIIAEKNIDVAFLNATISDMNVNENILDILHAIVAFDSRAIHKRTVKGLANAKSNGRIGGTSSYF